MPLYKDRIYYDTLKWDDIFIDEDSFLTKVIAVGSVTDDDDIKELYHLLSLKYVGASTRYTEEFPFIIAIRRELYIQYPLFIKQRDLLNDMMELEIAEIMKASNTLRNLVEHPTDPTPNADTLAIDNLSTQQENILMTSNKLDAIRNKYGAISKNYLNQIYKACDELFKVVLSDDTVYLYQQGE
jgi:hypothetical protein